MSNGTIKTILSLQNASKYSLIPSGRYIPKSNTSALQVLTLKAISSTCCSPRWQN